MSPITRSDMHCTFLRCAILIAKQHVIHTANHASAETALARLDRESLSKVFEVNTFGPILVSKASAAHNNLLINNMLDTIACTTNTAFRVSTFDI